ncbi:type II toxin-antitoxin system Phd/YefM family antitoxin [Paraburkholderia sp. MMS20-SJTN17]|uniref:Type II toxin-antitoxin system Phd/YefM family antitoxin n=1 Tax=Paraburkholderia translucens TaxID=2886945 RepID=A0ABS8KCI8_9BURK|nr:type II toxin-antitoxin system Phd/YefM family antitoxin [Paraburkholderia sp. MMS20-SJTN17]MCC8402486.1 type II toxin-antitoxin system Phd/YefM family antitoxin [Paraburkholderia sp. MMS20-SJTN17]
MQKRVSKAIFKSKACELFRQVEMLGETIVVTDRGQPTIEVRPYRSKGEDPLKLLRASIVHFDVKHSSVAVALEQDDR